MEQLGRLIIDKVEYVPNGYSAEAAEKYAQTYCGIGDRRSDGITCLSLLSEGGSRKHNIEVGAVRAITLNGVRHVLQTDPARWKIRSQELHFLIEGRYSEEWAADYFDPRSPHYHARPGRMGGREKRAEQSRMGKIAGLMLVLVIIALLLV